MSAGAASSNDIWRRLLWREYREGRVALVLALVLPQLVFTLAETYRAQGLYDGLRFIGALGVHLVILFWAISSGERVRGGAHFELVHLPIRPVTALTISFVVPAVASAAVGAAFGWCVSPDRRFAAIGAADVMTTFVFGYYFAAITSRWLAALVGVWTIIWGKLISVISLQAVHEADAMLISLGCAVGAAVGLYVFAKLIGRKPLAHRQLAALVAMAFFGLVPSLARLDPTVFDVAHWTRRDGPRTMGSAVIYWGQGVKVDYRYEAGPAVHSVIRFIVEPGGNVSKIDLGGALKTIGVAGKRYVYFAQQLGDSPYVQILEWDTVGSGLRSRVHEVARFHARKLAIPEWRMIDSVDPNRRYLLVTLNALIGENMDNWIVDLKTGKAAIFRPGASSYLGGMYQEAVWTPDRALIALEFRQPVVVDLESMSEIPFRIPIPAGGAR